MKETLVHREEMNRRNYILYYISQQFFTNDIYTDYKCKLL